MSKAGSDPDAQFPSIVSNGIRSSSGSVLFLCSLILLEVSS